MEMGTIFRRGKDGEKQDDWIKEVHLFLRVTAEVMFLLWMLHQQFHWNQTELLSTHEEERELLFARSA